MVQKLWPKPTSKIGRMMLFIGLGLVSLLCLSVAAQLDLPQPTGPYTVGRTARHWIDPSRPEALTEAHDDFREVPVEIWYPAEAGTGSPTPYFPNLAQVASALATSGEVEPWEVFGLRFIRSRERLEASLAEQATTYPVILLSPGNGTNVEFYAAIADELVSAGYIVVGLNHPYDVAAVALQNQHVAQFQEGPLELSARQAWVRERITVRTADVLFVLDRLQKWNTGGDSLLAGRLDLTQIGIMGHSLGGITAAEACRATAQLRACVNFDGLQQGGPFSASPNPTPPNQPFMMITKEQKLHPEIIALFEASQSGSYRVVLPQAQHDNFTDGPLLLPSLLPVPNQADQLLASIRAYTLAFFDQMLKKQPSQLLAKPLHSQSVWLEVYPSQE